MVMCTEGVDLRGHFQVRTVAWRSSMFWEPKQLMQLLSWRNCGVLSSLMVLTSTTTDISLSCAIWWPNEELYGSHSPWDWSCRRWCTDEVSIRGDGRNSHGGGRRWRKKSSLGECYVQLDGDVSWLAQVHQMRTPRHRLVSSVNRLIFVLTAHTYLYYLGVAYTTLLIIVLLTCTYITLPITLSLCLLLSLTSLKYLNSYNAL